MDGDAHKSSRSIRSKPWHPTVQAAGHGKQENNATPAPLLVLGDDSGGSNNGGTKAKCTQTAWPPSPPHATDRSSWVNQPAMLRYTPYVNSRQLGIVFRFDHHHE